VCGTEGSCDDKSLIIPIIEIPQEPLDFELSTPRTFPYEYALIVPDQMGVYMTNASIEPTQLSSSEYLQPEFTYPVTESPQWPSQLYDFNVFSAIKTEDNLDASFFNQYLDVRALFCAA
jgi:hypothetical protein